MSGMHTDRHHEALSLCVKALSKGWYYHSMAHPLLVWMAAVMRDSCTGSPARHQSRPDALFVRPIPGRQAHLDPSKIPPQDRDIHLVELKLCPDTNPFIIF
eukprot:1156351-Pelagomonas_calceolata.AAC.8